MKVHYLIYLYVLLNKKCLQILVYRYLCQEFIILRCGKWRKTGCGKWRKTGGQRSGMLGKNTEIILNGVFFSVFKKKKILPKENFSFVGQVVRYVISLFV